MPDQNNPDGMVPESGSWTRRKAHSPYLRPQIGLPSTIIETSSFTNSPIRKRSSWNA